jgi:phage tail-like protein
MAIAGNYRKLYPKFKFVVIVQDFESAAFQKASGFKVTLEEIKYAEGGSFVDYKEPGRMNVGDITLARGISKNVDFYTWIMECVNVMVKLPGGIGSVSPTFFKNLTIRQMDRNDTAAIDFKCYWAFPKDWTGGDWDNMANEVTMEELIIAYHHPERRTY